ncbi:MAG: hypothetical protein IKS20_13810, partial [Victivallales bacterium]|nr:hypothetical protein [Victivallales bacterium]
LEIKSAHRRMTKTIKVDFDSLPMRSREAKGFKLTSYEVVNIVVVNKGSDTPAPADAPEAPAPDDSAPPAPEASGVQADNAPAQDAQPEAAQSKEEKPKDDKYKQTSFFLDE